jgi:hypothetical protein
VAAEAGAFFAALASRSERWLLTAAQRRKLAPAVAAALAGGWTPDQLAGFAGASTTGIRNPYAVLTARLTPAGLPPPTAQRPVRPPWCGHCDKRTRMVDFDGDSPRPCPCCKPVVSASRAHAAQALTLCDWSRTEIPESRAPALGAGSEASET